MKDSLTQRLKDNIKWGNDIAENTHNNTNNTQENNANDVGVVLTPT